MQVDSEFAAVIGVFSSLATATIGYGIMKEKLRRVEKDLDDLRETCIRDNEKFVTHNHLNAVIEPMRRTLELVQKDVKEILHVVASSHRPKG